MSVSEGYFVLGKNPGEKDVALVPRVHGFEICLMTPDEKSINPNIWMETLCTVEGRSVDLLLIFIQSLKARSFT